MKTFTDVGARSGPDASPDLARRPRLGRRQELVAVALGAWLVTGAFLDGWAHTHRQLETVLTPWHAVLYGGFLASAGYTVALVRCSCRPPGRWPDSVPAGQGLAVAGVAVFGLGAVADQAWHALFGIEVDIAALVSPTHVLLFTGALLILAGPFRAAWASVESTSPSFGAFFPALVSLVLTTAVAAFAFMYLSPFRLANYGRGVVAFTREVTRGPYAAADYAENIQIVGIASIMVTTLIFLAPLLVTLRRWRPPFGTATVLFGAVAAAVGGIDAFQSWRPLLAAPLAGLVADVLIRRLDPSPSRPWSVRAVAAVVPVVLWLGFFAIYQLAYGVGWKPELWLGSTVMSALVGLGLSAVVVPLSPPAHV